MIMLPSTFRSSSIRRKAWLPILRPSFLLLPVVGSSFSLSLIWFSFLCLFYWFSLLNLYYQFHQLYFEICCMIFCFLSRCSRRMCDYKGACSDLKSLHMSLVQWSGSVHFKGPDQFFYSEGQDHSKDKLDCEYVLGLWAAQFCSTGNSTFIFTVRTD